MQAFPHHYIARASGSPQGAVAVSGRDTEVLSCAPPVEFGGPGDLWSPEELLLGAVANCFVLSFRAIARASKLEWLELECSAHGTLDRLERVTQFTELSVVAELKIADGALSEKAGKLLEEAEASCLITNSMKAQCRLDYRVLVG